MTKAHRPRGRTAVLVAVLTTVAAMAAYAFSAASASADGRALQGDFCSFNGSMLCMGITWDGVTYGTANRDDLSLRPGTYWLTVTDNTTMHDFALRSCPGSTLACTALNPAATTSEITTAAGTPGEVTDKVLLTYGTYRLYCDVGAGTAFSHETRGMYVDFEVGGVGELG
jgi:hypothetical protein